MFATTVGTEREDKRTDLEEMLQSYTHCSRNEMQCTAIGSIVERFQTKRGLRQLVRKPSKLSENLSTPSFAEAKEAQGEISGGKVMWKCIQEMQRGRRGLVPVKTSVKNEE